MKCKILIYSLSLALAGGQLLANKAIVQRRIERLEFVETQWENPERVMINIHYRVPVYDTLGYLAANYSDDEKLIEISDQLRSIAKRVNELSGEQFKGRNFPPEVTDETQQLRAQLFADVSSVYGQKVLQNVKAYIKSKNEALGL